MVVSNKARQERHRAKHPDREQTRQQSKRARFKKGQERTKGAVCAEKGNGPCAGKVEAHHYKGYGTGKATVTKNMCKRHHEKADARAKGG